MEDHQDDADININDLDAMLEKAREYKKNAEYHDLNLKRILQKYKYNEEEFNKTTPPSTHKKDPSTSSENNPLSQQEHKIEAIKKQLHLFEYSASGDEHQQTPSYAKPRVVSK